MNERTAREQLAEQLSHVNEKIWDLEAKMELHNPRQVRSGRSAFENCTCMKGTAVHNSRAFADLLSSDHVRHQT
jgi:hypothetical protein